jgi:hypothetical protein
MATQAGSTEDEDFPGLAALVSPAGEVARLPDWRAGSLVAEVAADVTVQPVREAVRCHTFWLGRWMTQRERWVLCRAEPFEVDPGHVATLSAEAIQELRWWSADELRAEAPSVTPRDLPGLLHRIACGDLPGSGDDLGV